MTVGVYGYDRDEVTGRKSWTGTPQQEFWSGPAATAGRRTAAVGGIRAPGDPLTSQAATGKRC